MRRIRFAALVVFLGSVALVAASGALAAAPQRHTEGSGLPFTGVDLKLVFGAGLALVCLGATLRHVARQRV